LSSLGLLALRENYSSVILLENPIKTPKAVVLKSVIEVSII
jgi:hypothetical protein